MTHQTLHTFYNYDHKALFHRDKQSLWGRDAWEMRATSTFTKVPRTRPAEQKTAGSLAGYRGADVLRKGGVRRK